MIALLADSVTASADPPANRSDYFLGRDDEGRADTLSLHYPSAEQIRELVRRHPHLVKVRVWRSDERFTPSALRELQSLNRLTKLWITGIPLTDAWAEELSHFPHLQELAIQTGGLTDNGIRNLSQLKHLETLYLTVKADKFTTEDDLKGQNVLRQFPQLQKLNLQGAGVSTLTMQEMGRLTELRSLYLCLASIKNITSDDIKFVQNLKQLESVSFHGSVTDEWLYHLGTVRSLRGLSIYGDFTEQGLEYLSGLSNIERLGTGANMNVTDRSLSAFRGMTQLKLLLLSYRKIDGSGLIHFRQMKNLEFLRLKHTNLQPEHVHHLAALTGLKYLDVSWTPLNRGENWKSLEVLKELEHLEELSIDLSNEDTQALQEMLPGVKVYFIE